MDIDLNKIITIYGTDMITLISSNMDEVNKNINYMIKLGFTDTEDIFERFTPLFIEDNIYFTGRINKLINKLGINYVDIIENDLSILEELL